MGSRLRVFLTPTIPISKTVLAINSIRIQKTALHTRTQP
ncbi:hypothetical protein NIES4075_53070 [Tolypothrix sp. NIES-4075]|nr:hypothetical protein NIES4075_53070 [Tolypothrix sp. NIES-4075]